MTNPPPNGPTRLPLETQNITAYCISNRGVDGAWDEAVRRLREVYDVQLASQPPEVGLALTISRILRCSECLQENTLSDGICLWCGGKAE